MKVLSRRRVVSPLISFLLLVFLFVYLAPILWMIVTSVKVGGDILTWPPIFIPAHPTLQNYKELIQNDNLLTYFRNSAIATVGGAVLATALGTLAAYGFVRLRWRWGLNRHLSLWILSLRMMPPVAALLPITILWTHLNLSDTYQGLILAYVFFTLPFAIWLMQIFMSAVPEEISEAAQVDGLSHIQIFRHIMLPLVAPGLATTLLLSANLLWNEFLFASQLTSSTAPTLPVLIAGFIGDRSLQWGPMAAAGTISIAPMIVLAILTQRHIVAGLTLGAVKD